MPLQIIVSGTENTAFVLRFSMLGLVNKFKSISHGKEFPGSVHLSKSYQEGTALSN